MQQKMWRCVVWVSLLFLIVCASVARSDSKAGNTGITGAVLVTPIRPGPIRAGSKFTTDAMGRFKVLLEPGHYVVLLAENRFPKPCGPFEVNVEAGKMTNVEWR